MGQSQSPGPFGPRPRGLFHGLRGLERLSYQKDGNALIYRHGRLDQRPTS